MNINFYESMNQTNVINVDSGWSPSPENTDKELRPSHSRILNIILVRVQCTCHYFQYTVTPLLRTLYKNIHLL